MVIPVRLDASNALQIRLVNLDSVQVLQAQVLLSDAMLFHYFRFLIRRPIFIPDGVNGRVLRLCGQLAVMLVLSTITLPFQV